jgi:hypothetical protein
VCFTAVLLAPVSICLLCCYWYGYSLLCSAGSSHWSSVLLIQNILCRVCSLLLCIINFLMSWFVDVIAGYLEGHFCVMQLHIMFPRFSVTVLFILGLYIHWIFCNIFVLNCCQSISGVQFGIWGHCCWSSFKLMHCIFCGSLVTYALCNAISCYCSLLSLTVWCLL